MLRAVIRSWTTSTAPHSPAGMDWKGLGATSPKALVRIHSPVAVSYSPRSL